jgi:hypothetical protein
MNSEFLAFVANAAGFLGLTAITLIPIRSLVLLRKIISRGLRLRSWWISLFSFLNIIAMVSALAIDVQIVAKIFRCLTQTYCGPNIASGWIYLAILGAIYLALELFFLISKLLGVYKTLDSVSSHRP